MEILSICLIIKFPLTGSTFKQQHVGNSQILFGYSCCIRSYNSTIFYCEHIRLKTVGCRTIVLVRQSHQAFFSFSNHDIPLTGNEASFILYGSKLNCLFGYLSKRNECYHGSRNKRNKSFLHRINELN